MRAVALVVGMIAGLESAHGVAVARELHPFFASQRRPIIIAHRGGGKLAPESTVPAFVNIVENFPEAVVEFDVRMTQDKHPVVIHDDTVKRTTNGSDFVSQLTLEQTRALDAGYCFSPQAPNGTDEKGCKRPGSFPKRGKHYVIPTLDEVLAVIPPDRYISVEVKDNNLELIDKVVMALSARRQDRLIVGSLHEHVARILADRLPRAAHYAKLKDEGCLFAKQWFRLDPKIKCEGFDLLAFPHTKFLPTRLAFSLAHAQGARTASYTVNERDDIVSALQRGADAIITDDPATAREVVGRMAELRVDVHCHIFNGADLPLRGFLHNVILKPDGHPTRRPLMALANSLARSVGRLTKGFAEEERVIDEALSRAGKKKRPPRLVLTGSPGAPASPTGDVAEVNTNEIALDVTAAAAADPQVRADLEAFVGSAESSYTEAPGSAPEARTSASLARSLVRRLESWLGHLKGYRKDNLEQLRSFEEVDIYVPAMVDLDLWLRDRSQTSLADQITLMAKLVVLSEGQILPFVAYDPWRDSLEAAGPTDSLTLVQRAVQEYGFAGVKIYPPMGFRPIGNTGVSFAHLKPDGPIPSGAALDERLKKLYAWAVREDVPILTHTSHSNTANDPPSCGVNQGPELCKDFSTNPKYWEDLLKQPEFKNLRINFGHFGGMGPLRGQRKGNYATRLAALVDRHPNVYADLSNFDIQDKTSTRRYFNQLDGLLAGLPALHGKLMYGSDWFMMAARRHSERYFDDFVNGVRKYCTPLQPGLFGENAVAFLGLRDGSGTRKRLDAFYRTYDVDPMWRRKVDNLPQTPLNAPQRCRVN